MQKWEGLIDYFWFAAILTGLYFLWHGCFSEPVKISYGRPTQIINGASASRPKARDKAKSGGKVVQTAYSQIGKGYVWGGESPGSGFDCSGLVWWAYRQHGIYLPRVSTNQYHVGRIVRGNLAPGDLVFFRSSLGNGRYHVGLFAGGNSFIHAPQTGSHVKIDSIEASRWRKRFIRAIRIL